MLGWEVTMPVQLLMGVPRTSEDPLWHSQYVCDLQQSVYDAYTLVMEHFHMAQQSQKKFYDTRLAGS